MGTKLNDYLEGKGQPATGASRARRAAFDHAYSIAGDLLELRLAHGLTQKELAARTGVPQSEISRIERGVVHPTDATWSRLGEALDAEVRLVRRRPNEQAPERARSRKLAGVGSGRSTRNT